MKRFNKLYESYLNKSSDGAFDVGEYTANVVEDVVSQESAENGDFESSEMVEQDVPLENLAEVYRFLYNKGCTVNVNGSTDSVGFQTAEPDLDFKSGNETNTTTFIYGLTNKDLELIEDAFKKRINPTKFENMIEDLK